MSKKTSIFYPQYQLRYLGGSANRLTFSMNGMFFSTTIPLLGMTETQKAVLRWARAEQRRPVVSISHEKPTATKGKAFTDPYETHRTYHPYATVTATVEYLGEHSTEQVRV